MNQGKYGRSLLLFAFAAATIIVSPALAHAQKVRVNWSKGAQFSNYKTYAWLPSKDDNHPFYRQYVSQFVEADLAKKGLQKVSQSQSPALLVTYHFLTQESEDLETNGFGYGGGGWGGWGGWGMGMGDMDDSTTTEVPVTMGLLSVDIINAKTKKIIWRGQAASDNVKKSTNGEEKEVQKSIDKMLDHYPPK